MDLIFQAQPHPHVKIPKLGQPVAVETAIVIALPADQYAGMAQGVVMIEKIAQPLKSAAIGLLKNLIVIMGLVRQWPAVLVNDLCPGKYSADLRLFIQNSHLFFKLCGSQASSQWWIAMYSAVSIPASTSLISQPP